MIKKPKGILKTVISLLLVAMLLCTGFVNIMATEVTESEENAETIADRLKENLLLYSNFDDENTNDVSGKGHHGSVVSGKYDNPTVDYVEGISGQAVHITGNELGGVWAYKYISYGDSSEIIPAKGDFTVSMFFKATSNLNTAKSYTLLSNTTHVSSYKEVGFMLFAESNTSDISQYLTFGTGGAPVAVSVAQSNTFETGSWYMLTVSFDRDGKMQLYINGVAVAEADISSYSTLDINSRNGALALGANCIGKLPTTDSVIDEFRIYDKALTADEIGELYTYTTTPAVSVTQDDSTVNYFTLDDALAAAEGDAVVKLLKDCTGTDITVPTGVTLDLNGKTFIVDTLYAVDGTAVIDTTQGEGRLVINESATLLDTDNAYGDYSYVAMKLDAEDDANTYALVPMILQAKADATSDSAMSVKIRPVVNLGDATAKTNELFGNGAQDNGLQFAIRVTWTAEDETEGKQTLTFADTLVAEAYTAGKAMTLNMSGIPANTALAVDLVIVSALGAETVSNLYTKGGN